MYNCVQCAYITIKHMHDQKDPELPPPPPPSLVKIPEGPVKNAADTPATQWPVVINQVTLHKYL